MIVITFLLHLMGQLAIAGLSVAAPATVGVGVIGGAAYVADVQRESGVPGQSEENFKQ